MSFYFWNDKIKILQYNFCLFTHVNLYANYIYNNGLMYYSIPVIGGGEESKRKELYPSIPNMALGVR